jgi:hypothetical protein
MFFYTVELLNNAKPLKKDELNDLINIVKDKDIAEIKEVLPNLHENTSNQRA